MVRIRNELRPLNRPPIDTEEMINLLLPMMNDRNRKIFYDEGGADFAHICDVDGVLAARVNLLQQMGKMGMVARSTSATRSPISKACIAPFDRATCSIKGWYCWPASPVEEESPTITRCSISSTARERVHILTLEDPIEFVYTEEEALI